MRRAHLGRVLISNAVQTNQDVTVTLSGSIPAHTYLTEEGVKWRPGGIALSSGCCLRTSLVSLTLSSSTTGIAERKRSNRFAAVHGNLGAISACVSGDLASMLAQFCAQPGSVVSRSGQRVVIAAHVFYRNSVKRTESCNISGYAKSTVYYSEWH